MIWEDGSSLSERIQMSSVNGLIHRSCLVDCRTVGNDRVVTIVAIASCGEQEGPGKIRQRWAS